MNRSLSSTGTALVLSGWVALSGCASTPAPLDQMGRSEAALSDAEESGAREYSPLELREAQKKYEKAKAAMAQEDNQVAKQLAEEAEIDAVLADVTARSTKAQQAAKEIRESIRLLRDEIDRASGT